MEKKLYTFYLSIARGAIATSIRRFISPRFVVMFLVSLTFWYVAKLSYTYTTELDVKIRVEDQKFYVSCVVQGVGTNLLGYHMYKGGALRLNPDELKYRVIKGKDGEKYMHIDKSSLRDVISVRYSDIKLISMSSLPDVLYSDEIKEYLQNK